MVPKQVLKRIFILLLALLFLGACRADVDVVAEVNEDGSGVVNVVAVLDADASENLLDLRTSGLALTDLNEAGWVTAVDARAADGATSITASKPFGTPAQFTEVMNELGGEGGLFSDFELVRTPGFARVQYEVSGSVKPAGFAAFSDPKLEASLGMSVEAIAARYQASASDVNITLSVKLPGERTIDADSGIAIETEDGSITRWTTTASNGSQTDVFASSSTRQVAVLVWRGIAIIAAGLALLALFGQILRVATPERRRPTNRPSARAVDKAPETLPVDIDDEETDSDQPDNPLVVALDAMGVIFKEANDIENVLIPFAHETGSPLTGDEIKVRARALTLGRMTTAQFWESIGLEGAAEELDDAYLSRLSLNPGVVKFLRTLRDRGVRVACITNDSTTWAMKLRQRHSLEALVDPWVVSGQVGVRKPDNPMWEVLRRVTGQLPPSIMVIDDDLNILDSARKLGFRTAWFAPEGEAPLARGHAILRSFELPEAQETPAQPEVV